MSEDDEKTPITDAGWVTKGDLLIVDGKVDEAIKAYLEPTTI